MRSASVSMTASSLSASAKSLTLRKSIPRRCRPLLAGNSATRPRGTEDHNHLDAFASEHESKYLHPTTTPPNLLRFQFFFDVLGGVSPRIQR